MAKAFLIEIPMVMWRFYGWCEQLLRWCPSSCCTGGGLLVAVLRDLWASSYVAEESLGDVFLSKTEYISAHGRIICVYEHGDLERTLRFGAWHLVGVLHKQFSHWVFMMLFRLIRVLHLSRLLEEKNVFGGCIQNGQVSWSYKRTPASVYGRELQRTCLR